MDRDTDKSAWLALLHQLPAKPPYLRVKVGRRLQAIGAVPLKNAVHVLPKQDETARVFTELADEIRANGGEAILIEARLIAGQSDAELRAEFDAVRDGDYEEIAQDARKLIEAAPVTGPEIERLRRRLADVIRLDFFGAHGRQGAEAALRELEERRFSHPDISRSEPAPALAPEDLKRRIWVTRRGVHVDRIASAWLIRRSIDPQASFKFVDGKGYAPEPGELRFDMADAEFTHEEDRCSFETLVLRAGLDDPALTAIGELIHELDIADGKFDRPEAAGLGAMLNGICTSTEDDFERIARGSDALDQFHAYFSNRKAPR
ncbi:chromate resistance protein ChrB domain-containing protein [Sphingomonas koreensis]|uniref:chromate resistance protein ChrB domain-containing protein n=1 Tax=Sphingomonas koreensis TaxID=93064 RepID=UPI00234F0B42|nr:chromate resistance protein ChrB domain-containing protein [Sphingomonas koreensis]MDC7810912.1 chromate resistance protein [Sphingomonas koreensis]